MSTIVNKDFMFKAKDLPPKANAKDLPSKAKDFCFVLEDTPRPRTNISGLQCLIGDAAAEGAPPASCERGYAPATAGRQATEPLPRVVGLLGQIHITPVDG